MERAPEQIQALIEEGEEFTYENFSTKGEYDMRGRALRACGSVLVGAI